MEDRRTDDGRRTTGRRGMSSSVVGRLSSVVVVVAMLLFAVWFSAYSIRLARGPPHPQGRSRTDRPRDLEHRARPLRAGDQRRPGEHAAHRSRGADFPARRAGLLAVGRRASAPHPPGGGVGARRVADLSAGADDVLALLRLMRGPKRQTSNVRRHGSRIARFPAASLNRQSSLVTRLLGRGHLRPRLPPHAGAASRRRRRVSRAGAGAGLHRVGAVGGREPPLGPVRSCRHPADVRAGGDGAPGGRARRLCADHGAARIGDAVGAVATRRNCGSSDHVDWAGVVLRHDLRHHPALRRAGLWPGADAVRGALRRAGRQLRRRDQVVRHATSWSR